jgi:adenosyl cobinamide kinase/adenosyl cobinamide phosphate guanylyltransferase
MPPFISTIIGFFGKFSIKQYIYGAIAILALTLALKGFNAVQAHFVEYNNLKEANTELTVQNEALVKADQNKQNMIDSLNVALETQAQAITIVTEEMGQVRVERDRQTRVLEGSRLGRLAAEAAGRIETRTNAATEERRAAIEEVINEDF